MQSSSKPNNTNWSNYALSFVKTNLRLILAYLSLTKPRVVVLLLITGISGLMLASNENLEIVNLFIFCLVGYASAGGAMVINSYIDRDIDIFMKRTSRRASVGQDAINHKIMLFFGFLLVTSSIYLALIAFNELTALLVSWGVIFYVIGYSLYLKRKTIFNTLLGGFASATPVWVGFAAGSNHVSITGLLLGLLVFLWNPAHTWTLAAKYDQDYRNARIPMFPTVYGLRNTAKITFILAIILSIYSLILVFAISNNFLSVLMLIIPHFLLIKSSVNFWKNPSEETAFNSFKVLNIWLAITFIITWLFSYI
ncbi:MAG: heme o synthase [Candidatus Hodarchaeales archaeon]|jgi:protoheme IX farnesyltransferase